MLKNLLTGFELSKKVVIVGPKIYYLDKPKKIWFAGGKIDPVYFTGGHIGINEIDKGQYGKPREVDFISGCCLMIKTDSVRKIGFLDTRYFLYYDDVEWALRAKKAGFKCYYVPQAFMYHKASLSVGGDSAIKHYYSSRGQLLLVEKNTSLIEKIIFLPRLFLRIIRLFWYCIIKKDKLSYWDLLGIKDYFVRNFGKTNYFKL